MHGVKLIWPSHVFPPIPYFDGPLAGDKPALMNFKNDGAGRKLAASVVGNRSLVYVTELQRFIWAIEFTGSPSDGERLRKQYGIADRKHWPFSVYVPIRFLARVDPLDQAPTRTSVCTASGVVFSPIEGDSYLPLSKDEYQRMYSVIRWTWEAGS